jgi:hypothetical protein
MSEAEQTEDEDMVQVPKQLVHELADQHSEVARYGYKRNKTAAADEHHSFARRLNDCTDRDWKEVGEDD